MTEKKTSCNCTSERHSSCKSSNHHSSQPRQASVTAMAPSFAAPMGIRKTCATSSATPATASCRRGKSNPRTSQCGCRHSGSKVRAANTQVARARATVMAMQCESGRLAWQVSAQALRVLGVTIFPQLMVAKFGWFQ